MNKNFQFSIFNFQFWKFLWKKPRVIIVTGNGRQTAKEAISQVLKRYFRIDKEILILETDSKDQKKFKFLMKNSSLPILVVTHIGDIPFDKDYNPPTTLPQASPFFAGEKKETTEIRKLAKILPTRGYLILNFDDETVREIKDETNLKELTFGLQEGADFRATDIKLNTGINFKINYKGNIVPVWLAPTPIGDRQTWERSLAVKEQIYSALSAAAVGIIFNLNLIEISQTFKNLLAPLAEP